MTRWREDAAAWKTPPCPRSPASYLFPDLLKVGDKEGLCAAATGCLCPRDAGLVEIDGHAVDVVHRADNVLEAVLVSQLQHLGQRGGAAHFRLAAHKDVHPPFVQPLQPPPLGNVRRKLRRKVVGLHVELGVMEGEGRRWWWQW